MEYVAIDPMALILRGDAYLTWVEIHHPHEPKVAEIEQVFKRMTAEQRKFALARARNLAAYCKAVEEVAVTLK